ncbi:MAG: 50S ribosomal protein L21 [Deltaproteobacteria bacterium]|nr:50S ribosomal protein L21 [Deltaproteobacteria bacterium]
MYAVVKVGGSQYRVSVGDTFQTQKIDGEEGSQVRLGEVLLVSGEGGPTVGTPIVRGAFVHAIIEKQGREKTLLVFRYKRRGGARKRHGTRQLFTRLRVTDIGVEA